MTRLIAIDPPGCGCTECIVGEYKPFDEASPEELEMMLRGRLRNNTYWSNAEVAERMGLPSVRVTTSVAVVCDLCEEVVHWEWFLTEAEGEERRDLHLKAHEEGRIPRR